MPFHAVVFRFLQKKVAKAGWGERAFYFYTIIGQHIDTVVFSIIGEGWPEKTALQEMLKAYQYMKPKVH